MSYVWKACCCFLGIKYRLTFGFLLVTNAIFIPVQTQGGIIKKAEQSLIVFVMHLLLQLRHLVWITIQEILQICQLNHLRNVVAILIATCPIEDEERQILQKGFRKTGFEDFNSSNDNLFVIFLESPNQPVDQPVKLQNNKTGTLLGIGWDSKTEQPF